jgi:tetratricopeptide (TPR) repeat protein
LLVERNRADLAQSHLLRAVQLDPTDARLRATYEEIRPRLEQIKRAELECILVIEGEDSDPISAERSLHSAYEICPDHVPILVAFGEFLVDQDRAAEAERYLTEALAIDPDEQSAINLLARVHSPDIGGVAERADGVAPSDRKDIATATPGLLQPVAPEEENAAYE